MGNSPQEFVPVNFKYKVDQDRFIDRILSGTETFFGIAMVIYAWRWMKRLASEQNKSNLKNQGGQGGDMDVFSMSKSPA